MAMPLTHKRSMLKKSYRFEPAKMEPFLEEFGSPLFLVYEDILHEQYRILRNTLDEHYGNSMIAYSFKTNPLSKICNLFKEEGALAEVVSGSEYTTARRLGFEGKNIVFNGPHKTDADLILAVSEGATINIDSKEEFLRLVHAVESWISVPFSIGIRLSSTTISNDVRNSHKRRALFERFGFNLENGDAAAFCSFVKNSQTPIHIAGYHMHIATDIADPDIYRHATEMVMLFASEMEKKYRIVPKYIDLGGGFADSSAVLSEKSNTGGSPNDFIRAISDTLRHTTFSNPPTLILEPGRFLVSRSTDLATRVLSVKKRGDGQLVTIDASESILPFAGPTNHYEISAIKEGHPTIDTIVGGASCMARDVLGRFQLPVLNEGDILVVKNCGAYVLARSSQFIFPRPATVWVDSSLGAVSLARKAETPDDLMRLDVV